MAKISECDLKLIGGEFLYDSLPPERQWLARYFESDLQLSFLVYYHYFEQAIPLVGIKIICNLFVDHTGYGCASPTVFRSIARIKILEKALEDAIRENQLEKISEIKLGKFAGCPAGKIFRKGLGLSVKNIRNA